MNKIELMRRRDETYGLRSASVLEQALEIAPHLGALSIFQGVTQSRFEPSPEEFDWSLVHVDERDLVRKRPIDYSSPGKRIAAFKQIFVSRGASFGVVEANMCILGHELGHADDYYRKIEEHGGDIHVAYKEMIAEHTLELESLPLGTLSSFAAVDYAQNTNGYRDRMEAHGFVGEAWKQMLRENRAAYQELPSELRADDFAIDVISSIPSLAA